MYGAVPQLSPALRQTHRVARQGKNGRVYNTRLDSIQNFPLCEVAAQKGEEN